MNEHGTNPSQHGDRPGLDRRYDAGHETEKIFDREIHLKAITWTVIGLLIVIVVSMWAMNGLDRLVRSQQPEARLSPLEEVRQPRTPPGPQLQSDPEGDLLDMLAEDATRLASYGWTDSTQQTARVPIDRAIDLVVERGVAPLSGPAPEAMPDEADGNGGAEAEE